MRRILPSFALLVTLGGSAAAAPQISADAPIKGLPAVSKDGKSFVRPVEVQPKDCTGVQTFVEVGTVGTAAKPGKTELLLVADQCGGKAKLSLNIDAVNERLRDGSYKSVGTLESRSLPTTIETSAGDVRVDAAGAKKCSVVMEGSASDRWQVKLEGNVFEVRGWYVAEAAGAQYLSVLVAVSADDIGEKGRERWVDFWPGGKEAADGTPLEIGVMFVESLAERDAKGIADLISTPFTKVGLKPLKNKSCKRKDAAKRDKDVPKIAACIAAGASELYGKYKASEFSAEIDMSEFPDELRKHKKKVAKAVKKGAKLVRYHVNQDGIYAFLVLVLDPDTDNRSVMSALEAIDVDD